MGFIHRLFGDKRDARPAGETGDATTDGKPVHIVTGKEDSLLTHIDRIQMSRCISPDRSYRGLLIYAILVSSPGSFLTGTRTIMQKAAETAALGDLSGTVLELKGKDERKLPRAILLRILGVVSYEGKKRGGELVIVPPGPQEPDIIIAFVLRGNQDIPVGEMKTDPPMAKIVKEALGARGRVPSEEVHNTISRMCRPDTPIARIPNLVGMISESLRREGIPESTILEFIRSQLSGTCPSCHRSYGGEEIVLLFGMKHSMRVQETIGERDPDAIIQRSSGDDMDVHRLLHRLNMGICLNPSCNSGTVDLSWN